MKRALGIDHGEARIGLALSDELGMLAHPLETVQVREVKDVLGHIAAVVERERVGVVVVGVPRNMNGTYGPQAEKVREFAGRLGERVPGVEVKFWDERLTSVAAQRLLHEVGKDTRKGRAVIDQVAAHLILQGWLDSQAMLG